MDTTDPDTGWQFPVMILPGDLSADDARELKLLDDEQRAAHHQARELLRDYAQHVLDVAEQTGRTPLTDARVGNWENLRNLMTVLLTNTDGHQR